MRLKVSARNLNIRNAVARSGRTLFRRGVRRKLVCLALMLNLLIWPGADFALRQLPSIAMAAINLASSPLRYGSFAIGSLFRSLAATSQQETPEQRLARLAVIGLSPIKYVGYQQQKVSFSALGLDLSGKAVNGIKFTFGSSDPSKLEVDEAGLATFLQPGLAWITCQAGNIQARAPVFVKAGPHPRQTDVQWLADQNTLAVDGTITIGSNGSDSSTGSVATLFEKLAPAAYAQSCGSGGDGGDFAYDEIWSEPRNLLGSPRNRAAEPTRMGLVLPEGSNFNFGVPIINLGGRGIGASLTLYYNSRLWSRHGNAVTFNAVNGWPYAGFSLGFGRVVTYGSDPSVTLRRRVVTTPSRHQMARTFNTSAMRLMAS